MNATFIGNLLYHTLFDEYVRRQSWQLLIFLILVVILNFLEIINNWASICKYFELFYNSILFLIDVITLSIFFWQIFILSELQKNLEEILITSSDVLERKIILIVFFSYLIVYILYVVWNFFILNGKGNKDEIFRDYQKPDTKEEILKSTNMRVIQIIFIIQFILPVIDFISISFIWLIFIVWIICTIVHNHTLDIFDKIIKSNK